MGDKSSSKASSKPSSVLQPPSPSRSSSSIRSLSSSKLQGKSGTLKKGDEKDDIESTAKEGKVDQDEMEDVGSRKTDAFFGGGGGGAEEVAEEDKEGGEAPEELLTDLERTTSGKSIERVVSEHHTDPQVTSKKWHEYFPGVPEDDNLIEDYRCAIQKEILVQGKLYVSENHLSFRGSVFGYDINFHIPWIEVLSIKRTMTALIIPNAIEIKTLNAKHVFSSLLGRDATYALAVAVWRHSLPDTPRTRIRSDSESTLGSTITLDENEISYTDDKGGKKHFKFKHKKEKGKGPGGSALKHSEVADLEDEEGEGEEEKREGEDFDDGGGGGPKHPATEYDGEVFAHEAGDFMVPSSPEHIYELMFRDEEFLRPFWEDNQKLHDIEVGQWEEDDEGRPVRDLSFIKPLHGPFGPKETLCEIQDVVDEMDPEQFVTVRTTTHTPNVPSGSTFFVKSRTVLTWNDEGGTRVQMSTEVEWVKPNWALKGIIERSCLDGQKTYANDMEGALTAFLSSEWGSDSDSKLLDDLESGIASEKSALVKKAKKGSSKSKSTTPPVPPSLWTAILSYLPPLLPLLAIFVVFLLITNFFTLVSMRTQARSAHAARVGSPEKVAESVQKVLEQFGEQYAVGNEGGEEEEEFVEIGRIVKKVRGQLGIVEERLERMRRGVR